MHAEKINKELGNLRRSTVVTTFGPGSIVDFRADGAPISAVVAGLEEWDKSFWPAGMANEQTVNEIRLQRRLGVYGFRLPPVIDETYKDKNGNPDRRSLVAVRFPIWLQCPVCDRIAPSYKWSYDPGKASNYCPSCTAKSPGGRYVHPIPVRFIMACENGHLDEFPWHWWINHKSNCKNSGFLSLKSTNPGLSGLILSCPECGAFKSMEGIFNLQNFEGITCKGKRPWLSENDNKCECKPRVLQRGASNLYFPVHVSALSIPPWSDRLQEALGIYWGPLIEMDSPSQRATFINILAENILKPVLEELDLTADELAKMMEERVALYKGDEILKIRHEEYRHFVSNLDTRFEDKREFEIRKVSVPDRLAPYFHRIVRVVRLREVMAIKGFTRINPPGDENDKKIIPISIKKLDWLPAIEVRGEGIFLAFDPEHLHQWERQKEVIERANSIQDSWQTEWTERGHDGQSSPVITPRYLLIHTFAHVLMRQLTLECGYSGASLRERLYISEGEDEMAGILVYTATSDSDGTLGGLQRQGEAEKITRTVLAAIKAVEWCSSDPLCIQGMVTAPENHSIAACHACCLAPETSCEHFNRFLDRAMLVGIPEKTSIGYFSSILERI